MSQGGAKKTKGYLTVETYHILDQMYVSVFTVIVCSRKANMWCFSQGARNLWKNHILSRGPKFLENHFDLFCGFSALFYFATLFWPVGATSFLLH